MTSLIKQQDKDVRDMLEGIKVLNFTHYLQGPSCAQTLADLGADVVKVESVKGAYERGWSGCNAYKNGVSVFFLLANRNERDLSIDLKNPETKEIIYDLVTNYGYDVIIENFRPGVMDKLGLGYEALKEKNPRVIYCSCTGYGSSGPYLKKPGQDLLIQSMSGLSALCSRSDHAPEPMALPAVDQHGATLAALGVLAAIIDRSRTGNGHRVEGSLLGSALDLQLEPLSYYLNGGQLSERCDTGLSTRFHQSPYGTYETKDKYLTLSLIPMDKLCQAFTPGCFEGWDSKRQMDERVAFDRIICDEMKKRTNSEWIEIFDSLDIWYMPVNEYDEMLKDPQVQYMDQFYRCNHPVAGDITLVGHAIRYDGKMPPLRMMPPELGQHTIEILHECGITDDRIADLEKRGLIRTHQA